MDKLIKELVAQIRQNKKDVSSQDAELAKDIQQIWDLSSQYKANTPAFDVDKNFAKFKNRTQQAAVPQQKARVRALWLMRSAAAILLLLAGAWLFNTLGDNAPMMQVAENKGSDELALTLQDGSSISLFPGASLEYPKNFKDSDIREVSLAGKAYFKISPNKEKPFIIQTQNTKVQVLGTEFLLEELVTAKETNIKVTEGKVEFTDKASGKFIQIVANEQGICRAGGILFKEALKLGDTTQQLDFDSPLNMQGKSVEEVIDWLEDNTEWSLELDQRTASCPVSGFFTINNAIDQLKKLGYEVKEVKRNSYEISGKCR